MRVWSIETDDEDTCPMCVHSSAEHGDGCSASVGYTHMGGFEECGCPLTMETPCP